MAVPHKGYVIRYLVLHRIEVAGIITPLSDRKAIRDSNTHEAAQGGICVHIDTQRLRIEVGSQRPQANRPVASQRIEFTIFGLTT